MSALTRQNLAQEQHLHLLQAKALADDIGSWFVEAPIDEIEVIEDALQQNAPIQGLEELNTLLAEALAYAYAQTQEPPADKA